MPKYITENQQIYILYDNCEEYVYVGGNDPAYGTNGVFVDVELKQCCQGQILDSIPLTPTPTITVSVSTTPTPTITVTSSITPTPSLTPTISQSPTPTLTPTPSVTPTISITPSITPSYTTTATVTPTHSPTPSITPSNTPTVSISPTCSPTITETPTQTPTLTPTTTITPTISQTPTTTPTITSTPIVDTIPGVVKLEISNNNKPYEIVSMGYGAPTSLLYPNNNEILAICAPLNDYDYNLTSIKPDLVNNGNRNVLLSTNTYFDNITINNSSVLAFNNRQWNYINYPTGRMSSVFFNKTLHRWFIGCQSTDFEPDIFLYSYDNASINRFYIGGNNLKASTYPGLFDNPSLNCGPTKIYSKDNIVILANNSYVYLYITPDQSSDFIDYVWKTLPFYCLNNNNDCGIDFSSIPTNILSLREHLPTIISYNNPDTNTNRIKLLYNPPADNNIAIDNISYQCNEDKGYCIESQDLSVNISAVSSILQDDNADSNHLTIKLSFNTSLSFNLSTDVKLMRGDSEISRQLWDLSGADDTYALLIINHALLDDVLANKDPIYTLEINLSSMNINTIPHYIKIPLYKSDTNYNISQNYFTDIRNIRQEPPAFIAADGRYHIDVHVKADNTCGCGYTYDFYLMDEQLVNQQFFNICMSDLPNASSDAELKHILIYDNNIYYIVQQGKDPVNPTGADNDIYLCNIYFSNINNANNLQSLVCSLRVRRQFEYLNRDITNKWNNTCFIDDNYLIVGVPNSNSVFRIDYKAILLDPGQGC